MANKIAPYFALGEIVKGFGRGSKELGCPTGMCKFNGKTKIMSLI